MVAILRRVPEKRLMVFDLATRLANGRGELDFDAAVALQPEVNLAVAEAEVYARATRRAVEALLRLPPR